ncbi:ABC transporter permease [Nocardia sp. CDC159]|uniref:ABC transporter permease n=1 Tax=Nocardia pulmonis TaxID=2951408 RepID=A0A9X2IVJ6_9NOCA|nr:MULTISPECIES: ABC transporter permease [Nocardia]MCM6772539.1 ABC transporter permease [Nocardia pulmonis]MCM6784803.1 ABC transporter permease [Nocardia sp. CDC159]
MLSPAVRTLGRTVLLAAAALGWLLRDSASGRLPWRDAVVQSWFVVSVTAVPAVFVAVPFGVIVSVQVGQLTQQIGATSLAGAAAGVGVVRQGAPLVAALLLGGAAGAAIAADLGSRTVREEIDAMRVMGIDPVRRLLVPRLAAMVFVAPLLCVVVVFMGLATGYVINVGIQHGTAGGYLSSIAAFVSVPDLIAALVKSALFGLVVVVLAGARGLTATAGPKGVADAVNAAVVLGVVATFALNLIVTQALSVFGELP